MYNQPNTMGGQKMSQMKLGTKIALGFGLLIIIAVGLGGMATWNMKAVGTESNKLADEYAPEVAIANDVERSSLLTMFAMRGYATTEENHYLQEGKKHLKEVNKYLDDAMALADKSAHLTKLKAAVPQAQKGVSEYERLVEETVDKNIALEDLRKKMDAAANEYMENCGSFLNTQNQSMKIEFESGASLDKLEERLTKITLVNDIIDMGNEARAGNFKSQAMRDPKLLKATIDKFDGIVKLFDQLQAITRQDFNLRQIEATRQASDRYSQAMEGFLKVWLDREQINKERENAANRVLESAQNTSMAGVQATLEIAKAADDKLAMSSNVMVTGLVVALIIGCTLAFLITRSITGPINRVITGLNDGAEQVASASGQVSSASQEMAEGASEQAASIEETSSSLEEMSSITKQNADNASHADQLMNEAEKVVQQANESMQKLNHSMTDISKASEETSKIIKTIDEIAFQTNLLALNAAVEAARAGEAGAGFAVVADEVRNLAMRAADAAKNTAELIEGTVKKVTEGSVLSDSTMKAFDQVAESAGKVGQLIGEISSASSEQAQGIQQVNTAVSEMDKVVQQNAANAEESASASEEMNAQAEQLKEMVKELVSLVGGTAKGTDSGPQRVKSKIANRASGHQMYKGTSKKGQTKNLPAGQSQEIEPSQVIPLDDDFKDF